MRPVPGTLAEGSVLGSVSTSPFVTGGNAKGQSFPLSPLCVFSFTSLRHGLLLVTLDTYFDAQIVMDWASVSFLLRFHPILKH